MLKIKSVGKYYQLLIIAGIMWGFYPLIFKNTLLVISIFGLIAIRYLVGALFTFLLEHKKIHLINRKMLLLMILFAIFGSAIPAYLFTLGVAITDAVHASVLSIASPFLVYLFSAIILKNKIHKNVIGGSVVASIGLLIILMISTGASNGASFKGDALILISQALAALAVVFAKKVLSSVKRNFGPEQLTFYEYLLAGLTALTIIFIFRPEISFSISHISSLVWLLLIGTIAGALPTLLFYKSEKFLTAERVADVNFISPLAGSIVAITLLGESVNLIFLFGAVLLVIGLLISNNKLHPMIISQRMLKLEQAYEAKLSQKLNPKLVYERIVNRR